ncbi:MAG: DUF3943 domain-containing protein [Gemmatimonadetes bacterium]|nr:DUF3943 domain-containing protein [Gemmatimonadota bacterium]
MRARTTITALLGATLLLGVASPGSAQVRPLPDDTLEYHYEGRKSVWMALGQVTAMNGLVWGFDYLVQRKEVFQISPKTFATNLGRVPEWDTNTFGTNQLMHPYNGVMFYGAARAEGFSPLASAAFTLVGSAQWEWLWETVNPSANDLYMTIMGGITLGESLGRLSAGIRQNRSGGLVGIGQGLLAGLLDPGGSINRGVLGGTTPDEFLRPSIANRVLIGASTSPGLETQGENRPATSAGARGLFRLEIEYGDRFASRKQSFFDAFELDFQFGGGTSGVGVDELRVRGVLFSGPRDRIGQGQSATYLDQEFEFSQNPAYSFGTQSFNASYRYRYVTRSGKWELGARMDARAIPLAGVSSEHANGELARRGICSEPSGEIDRDYDYGSGVGAHLAGSVKRSGREVLKMSYGTSWVRTFSGADGSHLVQEIRVRGTLPITRGWALSAGWEMQTRDSQYDDLPAMSRTNSSFSLSASYGAF